MADKPVAANGAALVERVVIEGDLAKLSPAERVSYYRQVCESLGLNPLTKPFDYIVLNGKLTLYARKDATDQLRRRDGVSITSLTTQVINDVYVVTATATAQAGERQDVATGAVSIKGLSGDALANAMMKAETKAKRRVTLSICGLGILDETEIETVAEAKAVTVDAATGEIGQPIPQNKPPADMPFAEYIKDPRALRGFWTWAKRLGLSEDEVHHALGVAHLNDVTLTVAEVKERLTDHAANIFQEDSNAGK